MFGKILLFIAIFCANLFAVNSSVSKDVIIRGDSIEFIIDAEGSDITFPEISSIEGYRISGTSSSQSVSIINGKMTKKLVKSYSFTPLKDMQIPPFEVKVDGKIELTNPIDVIVKDMPKGKDADFIFEANTNVKEIYVGEPFIVEYVFKRKLSRDILDLNFIQPSFVDFWKQELKQQDRVLEGDYVKHSISFLLIAQNAGDKKIDSGRIEVAVASKKSDIFGGFVQVPQWRSIDSNDVAIKVLPLPENLKISGNYEISSSIDKQKVDANSPVNLTIKLKGYGNFDDIEKFDLHLDGVTVFADKPKVTTNYRNGKLYGEFEQKIALVASKSYTVPKMSFKYFDIESKKVKTLYTDSFDVEVIGTEKKVVVQKPKVEAVKEKAVEKESTDNEQSVSYIYLVFALIMGGFIGFIISKIEFKKKKKYDSLLKHEIKTSKNDKDILEVILPFISNDKELSQIADILEENIYEGKKHYIDKKLVIKLLEKYEVKNDNSKS